MRLRSMLSKEDLVTIKEYAESYSDINKINLDYLLNPWAKAKTTLFKLLDNKLRYIFEANVEVSKQEMIENLSKITCTPNKYHVEGRINTLHPFIVDLSKFLDDLEKHGILTFSERSHLNDYFFYRNFITCTIENGYSSALYTFENPAKPGKAVKINAGMRTMRAIQKLLNFYDYPRMDLFNDWKDKISVITTVKSKKVNVTLSIHPLEFMTASDNANNWSSCMSWRTGGYSSGTLEMLNSNMVLVAYIENEKDKFIFNEHEIPNKSWRAFFYVHKKIICSGKGYPYQNPALAKSIVKEIEKLAKKNLGWKYQYDLQLYRDLLPFYNNGYLRTSENLTPYRWTCDWGDCNRKYHRVKNDYHKSILICTTGMYNDILEDHDTEYWCVRNYVDKNLRLNASGKAYCLACGRELNDYSNNCEDDEEFHTHGSHKYCSDCETTYKCKNCGALHIGEKMHRIKTISYYNLTWASGNFSYESICDKCFQDEMYFEEKNSCYISKDMLKYYMERKERIDAEVDESKARYQCREGVGFLYQGKPAFLIPFDMTSVIRAKEKGDIFAEEQVSNSIPA